MNGARALLLTAATVLAGVAQAVQTGSQVFYDTRMARAAFLARTVGARAAGMGEAFTAVGGDPSGASWNPAGLGGLGTLAIAGQVDAATQGPTISSLSAASPVGPVVLGGSLQTAAWGDITYRDPSGAETGHASPVDAAFTQSFAFRSPRWLGDRGWAGFGVEFVQEAQEPLTFGFNFGGYVPVTPDLSLGFAFLHIGGDDRGALPMMFRMGSACGTRTFSVATDFSYQFVGGMLGAAIGAEYQPVPALTVRAGYRRDARDEVGGGLRGPSLGLGWRQGRWSFDYAFQPFGDLTTAHRLGVQYQLPAVPKPVALTPEQKRAAARAAKAAAAGPMPVIDADPGAPAVMPKRPGDETPTGDGKPRDALLPPPPELEAPAEGGDAGPVGVPRRGERP